MNLAPSQSAMPPPWYPFLPPNPPPSSVCWNSLNVQNRMRELQETLTLAKAMKSELEALMWIRNSERPESEAENGNPSATVCEFLRHLEDRNIGLELQEKHSIEAANSLMVRLQAQLEPFKFVADETGPWEEKSAAFRLSDKLRKSRRNKLWRKRKRHRAAEQLEKEREQFDQADHDADEWRAREIAKDIAKRKVEKMKEIAKLKAKEERKRLESELELVLIVEKLQELRSIRILKLKKQGHFLPEEDDQFLEKVRVAVEEEERQARVAAETDTARDAIATAEESRKVSQIFQSDLKDQNNANNHNVESQDQMTDVEDNRSSLPEAGNASRKEALEGKGHYRSYDAVANLPIDFYHYYHGSNADIGTLIEANIVVLTSFGVTLAFMAMVRRTWDAYIRPGGSRIPGHWVQPPPPADEVWASYLVKPPG